MSDEEQGRPPEVERSTRSGEGTPEGSTGDAALLHKRLGDFELLREIGRGGMGVVYEARQISLNRHVALKVLPSGLSLTEQAVRRFEREAQAAAKLHHTHIIPVHATGDDQGCHYYAMELIEGQSLAKVLEDLRGERSNPLMETTVTQVTTGRPEYPVDPPNEIAQSTSRSDTGGRRWFDSVAKLLTGVGDALHYAHDHGVIHRDVKPANLLLSRDGRLCLGDFGLARVAQEPGMTVSGSFLGTPAYMSPEQVAAGRVKLDHRTDIYSLGVVLYEMLTLQRPFSGDSREQVLTGILSKDPLLPRRINPRIPVDLETICLKAMEKDPDRRYATAGEMSADLEQYLQRGLIGARRAGPLRRFGKRVRRHPAAATAIVATVLLVSLGVVALQSSRAERREAAHRALADARVSLGDGEYRESLRKADRALDLDPELVAARLVRARALMNLHRLKEAVEQAQAMLARDPDDWTARLILVAAARRMDESTLSTSHELAASAKEQTGDLERRLLESSDVYYLRALLAESSSEAVDLLDRALELDPGNVEALIERISRRLRIKDFEAALLDCERLIAARPRSAEGRALMGRVYGARHDMDRARAEFDRAIEIDPEEPRYYLGRARLGGGESADADYAAAITLDPGRAASLAEQAWRRFQQGDREGAVADAQRAVELDATHLDAYDPLLYSHLLLGNMDRVAETRKRLVEASASWPDRRQRAKAHVLMAVVAIFSQDAAGSLAEADLGIELDPENWGARVARAGARKVLEGEPAAEEDCRAGAAIALTDPDDLVNRAGAIAGMRGRGCWLPEAALADYSAAIEKAPDWADPYLGRGRLYRELRRFEESLVDLERAIDLAPSWSAGRRARGQTHYDMERFAAALEDFDKPGTPGFNKFGEELRASSLVRLGRGDEAVSYLRDLENTQGSSLSFNQALVDVLFDLGRIDDALQAADRAIEVHSKAVGLVWMSHLQRASCLTEQPGRCAEREASALAALEMAPEDPHVAHMVAFLIADSVNSATCSQMYDGARALDLAQRAAVQEPDDPESQDALGYVLYRLDRFEEARSALLKAHERYPNPDVGNLFVLAMTSRKLGRAADAADYYSRAVARLEETYPDNPTYLRMRNEAAAMLRVGP